MTTENFHFAHQNVPGRCLQGNLLPMAGHQVRWLQEGQGIQAMSTVTCSPGSEASSQGSRAAAGLRSCLARPV